MKAYFKHTGLRPPSFTFGEVKDPRPENNQLLIEVKAASINPVDYKLMNTDTRFLSGTRMPRIVGSDFAGIVRKAAEGDTVFREGDRVYGIATIVFGRPGSLAELLVTDPRNARHIPDGMPFAEAAALPVAALTALNGLRRCGVTQGTNLLVNGATGGVGHFAVQIARARGAIITASCSPANAELALSLGADRTTGYRRGDRSGLEGSFDAILDAWGHMPLREALRLLKRGGTFASPLILYAPTALTSLGRFFSGKRITSSNVRKWPEDYTEIEQMFQAGTLKPVIEHRLPLERAAEAMEIAMKGRPRGKVIVTIE